MTIVASTGESVSVDTGDVRSKSGRSVSWQESMRTAIRDADDLCRRLSLPDDIRRQAVAASKTFSVFAPLEYVARMRSGDAEDPLLRQVLPLEDELREQSGFTHDPLEEFHVGDPPGLLHKYEGRVLLVTTGACAIHCRYCFRRHFPYSLGPKSMDQWRPVLKRVEADSSIDEILLSGGDPLTLADSRLEELIGELSKIDHLRRLRIHTRLPIVIPQRVTDSLIQVLRGTRLACFVVVHANHPQELGSDENDPVCRAFARLVDQGIPVLNQAVLLHGINDDVEVLEQLHRRLVNQRVMPYYLHQLDRVSGAAHFETPLPLGKQLVEQLRERLPGFAVPRFVRELPGFASKTALS